MIMMKILMVLPPQSKWHQLVSLEQRRILAGKSRELNNKHRGFFKRFLKIHYAFQTFTKRVNDTTNF